MSIPIFIYGMGGLGNEVKALLHQLPEWELQGYYDDAKEKGSTNDGIACLGGLQQLLTVNKTISLVLAIGNPKIKQRLSASLEQNAFIHFPILIHPSVIVLEPSSVQIGEGSILTAGSVLTTRITVGKHVLLNLKTSVGHDTSIGDYCSIMPGVNLAGEVVLEDAVLVGSGANVLNKIVVGAQAQVGAGAVVTKHVPANSTVVGVPAKVV